MQDLQVVEQNNEFYVDSREVENGRKATRSFNKRY